MWVGLFSFLSKDGRGDMFIIALNTSRNWFVDHVLGHDITLHIIKLPMDISLEFCLYVSSCTFSKDNTLFFVSVCVCVIFHCIEQWYLTINELIPYDINSVNTMKGNISQAVDYVTIVMNLRTSAYFGVVKVGSNIHTMRSSIHSLSDYEHRIWK